MARWVWRLRSCNVAKVTCHRTSEKWFFNLSEPSFYKTEITVTRTPSAQWRIKGVNECTLIPPVRSRASTWQMSAVVLVLAGLSPSPAPTHISCGNLGKSFTLSELQNQVTDIDLILLLERWSKTASHAPDNKGESLFLTLFSYRWFNFLRTYSLIFSVTYNLTRQLIPKAACLGLTLFSICSIQHGSPKDTR